MKLRIIENPWCLQVGEAKFDRHLVMSKLLYGNVLSAVACEKSAQGGTVASKIDSHSVVALAPDAPATGATATSLYTEAVYTSTLESINKPDCMSSVRLSVCSISVLSDAK